MSSTIRAQILDHPDKSDPLNHMIVLGAKRLGPDGEYLGGWRSAVTLTDPANPMMRRRGMAIALGNLIEAVRAHPDGDPTCALDVVPPRHDEPVPVS